MGSATIAEAGTYQHRRRLELVKPESASRHNNAETHVVAPFSERAWRPIETACGARETLEIVHSVHIRSGPAFLPHAFRITLEGHPGGASGGIRGHPFSISQGFRGIRGHPRGIRVLQNQGFEGIRPSELGTFKILKGHATRNVHGAWSVSRILQGGCLR